jgi:hypothetical protein
MPVFGPLMIKAALARYLQTLSLLLDNAVAMPEALSLAADACTIASYRQKLSVMREAVIMMPKLMATAIIAPRSDEVWAGGERCRWREGAGVSRRSSLLTTPSCPPPPAPASPAVGRTCQNRS